MQRVPRIHVESLAPESEVSLSPEAIRHLKVLRLAPGEQIVLFDKKGNEATGTLSRDGLAEGKVRVGKVQKGLIPHIEICLATVAPKGERWDWLVEKAAELGISELLCVKSERSIVAPSPAKLGRAAKIALEAAAQSGRSSVMRVGSIQKSLNEILSYGKEYGLCLLAELSGQPAAEVLEKVSRNIVPKNILCLVGPEGGFSPAEKTAILAAGFVPVTLNPATLRVETACLALAAQLTGFLECQAGR
jgi:16S rRNA (uracil1498-N3)-methyltransferase